MGGSFLNIIFIVVLLVIFIGRTIAQARKKQEEPPPPQPHIPVHFEDDPVEEPEYFKGKGPAHGSTAAPAKKPAVSTARQYQALKPLETYTPPALNTTLGSADADLFKPPAAARTTAKPRMAPAGAAPGAAGAGAAAPGQKGFPANLSRLSPLKQAVVMAEVLGPPKGLQ
ncbi:MAG: hypothetical protein FWC45_04580 [Treponema sp.]|nr:hypothetical protein [Treponema sp.]